jgi:superfamily II DNA or RNA helicase
MTPPLFKHQVSDIELIIKNPYFMNASEQGSGKTRTAIEAAQRLYQSGEIDQLIVVAPAPLRTNVWWDEELGQLKQYLTVPAEVTEYWSKTSRWDNEGDNPLHVIVTNYEFLRPAKRLEPLLKVAAARKTFLILDESSAVSSHTAQQTKACAHLRAVSKRVLLMNGTPVDESPGHAYAQFRLMHPSTPSWVGGRASRSSSGRTSTISASARHPTSCAT